MLLNVELGKSARLLVREHRDLSLRSFLCLCSGPTAASVSSNHREALSEGTSSRQSDCFQWIRLQGLNITFPNRVHARDPKVQPISGSPA